MNQTYPKSLIVSYVIDGNENTVPVNRSMTRDEINEIFGGIDSTKVKDLKIGDTLISSIGNNTTVADVVLALTATRTQKEIEEHETSELDKAKEILKGMANELTNEIEMSGNIDSRKREKRKIEIKNIRYNESDKYSIKGELISYGQTIIFEIPIWRFRTNNKLEIRDPNTFSTQINNKKFCISMFDLHHINACMHYLTVMGSRDKENPFCYDYDANGNYICIKDAQKTFDGTDFGNFDKAKKLLKYLRRKPLLRLFRVNKWGTDLSGFIKLLNEKALEEGILSQYYNTNSN